MIEHYPEHRAYFVRSQDRAEIDLLLERGGQYLAFDFKHSKSPSVQRGMRHLIQELKPTASYLVAPVNESYPIDKTITVRNLLE